MEDSNIVDILEILEEGYDIISSNFPYEPVDFLGMGDVSLDENVLPSLDIPMTLANYFKVKDND